MLNICFCVVSDLPVTGRRRHLCSRKLYKRGERNKYGAEILLYKGKTDFQSLPSISKIPMHINSINLEIIFHFSMYSYININRTLHIPWIILYFICADFTSSVVFKRKTSSLSLVPASVCIRHTVMRARCHHRKHKPTGNGNVSLNFPSRPAKENTMSFHDCMQFASKWLRVNIGRWLSNCGIACRTKPCAMRGARVEIFRENTYI